MREKYDHSVVSPELAQEALAGFQSRVETLLGIINNPGDHTSSHGVIDLKFIPPHGYRVAVTPRETEEASETGYVTVADADSSFEDISFSVGEPLLVDEIVLNASTYGRSLVNLKSADEIGNRQSIGIAVDTFLEKYHIGIAEV